MEFGDRLEDCIDGLYARRFAELDQYADGDIDSNRYANTNRN